MIRETLIKGLKAYEKLLLLISGSLYCGLKNEALKWNLQIDRQKIRIITVETFLQTQKFDSINQQ